MNYFGIVNIDLLRDSAFVTAKGNGFLSIAKANVPKVSENEQV